MRCGVYNYIHVYHETIRYYTRGWRNFWQPSLLMHRSKEFDSCDEIIHILLLLFCPADDENARKRTNKHCTYIRQSILFCVQRTHIYRPIRFIYASLNNYDFIETQMLAEIHWSRNCNNYYNIVVIFTNNLLTYQP